MWKNYNYNLLGVISKHKSKKPFDLFQGVKLLYNYLLTFYIDKMETL